MRTIYFIRHGEPDTGTKEKVCLGRKDVELSENGIEQARLLAKRLEAETGNVRVRIFSSPLKRCVQTAEQIAGKIYGLRLCETDDVITVIPDFAEVDTGIWDGMTFHEIKEKFPEEYEERGKHLGTYVIPGGESLEQAGERFLVAVRKVLENLSDNEPDADVLIVSHAGVIQAMLCEMTGISVDEAKNYRIPYCGVIKWNEILTCSDVEQIWDECELEPRVTSHMKKVAQVSLRLALTSGTAGATWEEGATGKTMSEEGRICQVHPDQVYYAALLHDIMRKSGKTHPEEAAEYLRKRGLGPLAEMIRMHHDPEVYQEGQPLCDAELLYYADKLVQEDRMVTLDERFGASMEKCRTPEARENHRRRWNAALGIEGKVHPHIEKAGEM